MASKVKKRKAIGENILTNDSEWVFNYESNNTKIVNHHPPMSTQNILRSVMGGPSTSVSCSCSCYDCLCSSYSSTLSSASTTMAPPVSSRLFSSCLRHYSSSSRPYVTLHGAEYSGENILESSSFNQTPCTHCVRRGGHQTVVESIDCGTLTTFRSSTCEVHSNKIDAHFLPNLFSNVSTITVDVPDVQLVEEENSPECSSSIQFGCLSDRSSFSSHSSPLSVNNKLVNFYKTLRGKTTRKHPSQLQHQQQQQSNSQGALRSILLMLLWAPFVLCVKKNWNFQTLWKSLDANSRSTIELRRRQSIVASRTTPKTSSTFLLNRDSRQPSALSSSLCCSTLSKSTSLTSSRRSSVVLSQCSTSTPRHQQRSTQNNRQFYTSSSTVSSSSSIRGFRCLPSILIAILLLSGNILTAHAMLDALKALFILTGASTYLVTKHSNMTANRTDFYGLQPFGILHPNGTHYFHQFNNASRAINGGMNSNNFNFNNKGDSFTSDNVRPMYVLTLDEEEDEKQLPKLLLKLSLGDSSTTTSSSSGGGGTSQQQKTVEYILDAKMEDFGPVRENFAVNKSTGELFLTRSLDRDPPNGRASWKFSVQARNSRSQLVLAVADVLINVRDINDNKPLFEQKTYQTTLIENGPAGQILTKVTAIDFDDSDTADNGKVMYSLLKSAFTTPGAASLFSRKKTTNTYSSSSMGDVSITDYFQIDPHTGVLSALACCFDREKRDRYTLLVRATDALGLSDQATIEVSVIDVNDSPPKFVHHNRTLTLQDASLHNSVWIDQAVSLSTSSDKDAERHRFENSVNGAHGDLKGQRAPSYDEAINEEMITTLAVTDEDLPETNRVSFELVNATNCSLFHKFYVVTNDDGSGSLFGIRARLTEPLEPNRTYSCELTISVQDAVRETDQSPPKVFEDLATIRLLYRNTSQTQESNKRRVEQTSNAASVISDNGKSEFEVSVLGKSDAAKHGLAGLKALDTTGNSHNSDCNVCQNDGQCVVTESSTFRFRCFCLSGFEGALCERPASSSSFQFEYLLAAISTNQLLFYGTLIIIVNLLVVVLGLMVWAIKRVKTSSAQPSPCVSENNLESALTVDTSLLSAATMNAHHGMHECLNTTINVGGSLGGGHHSQMVDTSGFLHLELSSLQSATTAASSSLASSHHFPTASMMSSAAGGCGLPTTNFQQQQPSPLPLLQSPLMINCTIIDSSEYEQKVSAGGTAPMTVETPIEYMIG